MMLASLMCGSVLASAFFVFFQAEDGIRDVAVTGVQTCALPISGKLSGFVVPDPVGRALRVSHDRGNGMWNACAGASRRIRERSRERRSQRIRLLLGRRAGAPGT